MFNAELANVTAEGRQIVQRHRKNDREWIVLCYWQGNSCPYVVWTMNNQGDTYWGHYFRTYGEAETRYFEKIGAVAVR